MFLINLELWAEDPWIRTESGYLLCVPGPKAYSDPLLAGPTGLETAAA